MKNVLRAKLAQLVHPMHDTSSTYLRGRGGVVVSEVGVVVVAGVVGVVAAINRSNGSSSSSSSRRGVVAVAVAHGAS